MATLANRNWWTIDAHGKPLKVRCVSHNVVLGTVRVITDDGVFAEIDARELHRESGDVEHCAHQDGDGIWTTITRLASIG